MIDKEPILPGPKEPKGFWGRLFCCHIDKEIGREELRTVREREDGIIPTYFKYRYDAIHFNCIKCGRVRTEERRVLLV